MNSTIQEMRDSILSMIDSWHSDLRREVDDLHKRERVFIQSEVITPGSDTARRLENTIRKPIRVANSAIVKLAQAKRAIPKIKDGPTKDDPRTWKELLDKVTDHAEAIGEEAEYMKLAAEKVRADLSEYHEYVTGRIGKPFLNHRSVVEPDGQND